MRRALCPGLPDLSQAIATKSYIGSSLLVLQMGARVVPVPHRQQDAGRLPCFQDGHHLVALGIPEGGLYQLAAPALVPVTFWGLQNRSTHWAERFFTQF